MTNTASLSLQRLTQILEQEAKGGYNNTAVIGGLDLYLSRWLDGVTNTNERHNGSPPPLPSPSYHAITTLQRRSWTEAIAKWMVTGEVDTPKAGRKTVATVRATVPSPTKKGALT